MFTSRPFFLPNFSVSLAYIWIVFEKCLAQDGGPSRANFQQKIMCAF